MRHFQSCGAGWLWGAVPGSVCQPGCPWSQSGKSAKLTAWLQAGRCHPAKSQWPGVKILYVSLRCLINKQKLECACLCMCERVCVCSAGTMALRPTLSLAWRSVSYAVHSMSGCRRWPRPRLVSLAFGDVTQAQNVRYLGGNRKALHDMLKIYSLFS